MGSWDTTGNRYETNSYGWGQTGYVNDEGPRDHVCKPVIIDAQGRKRPLIACGQNNHNGGYVTKTPQVNTYSNTPPKDYGVLNDGWSKPSSPGYDRPNRTNIVSSLNWRQTPSNGYGSYGGTNNYGGSYDNGLNGWNKPIGNTMSDPYFNGHQERNHTIPDSQEPTMITTGGWARPNRVGWATPPLKESPLSKPTHDIGTAVEYLAEPMKPTSVNMTSSPQFTTPTPTVPTIDSREARRRYGSVSSFSQVVQPADAYSSAINSREAARIYGGKMM